MDFKNFILKALRWHSKRELAKVSKLFSKEMPYYYKGKNLEKALIHMDYMKELEITIKILNRLIDSWYMSVRPRTTFDVMMDGVVYSISPIINAKPSLNRDLKVLGYLLKKNLLKITI